MKKLAIAILMILIVAVVVLVSIRLLTPEDDWICDSGQWTRHGSPVSPIPTEPCK